MVVSNVALQGDNDLVRSALAADVTTSEAVGTLGDSVVDEGVQRRSHCDRLMVGIGPMYLDAGIDGMTSNLSRSNATRGIYTIPESTGMMATHPHVPYTSKFLLASSCGERSYREIPPGSTPELHAVLVLMGGVQLTSAA